MEHTDKDGLLRPPSIQEQTEIPLEGLTPQPIRRLTLDEADLYRATKAFVDTKQPLPSWFIMGIHNHAYSFSKYIIDNCPEGKERSQALGQVHAAVLWAMESGIKNS